LIFILIAVATVLLPGCAWITGEETGEHKADRIPVTTEFGRVLGFVPYSFLEEDDIWFGDPGRAKQIYGYEDIKNLDELTKLSNEEIHKVIQDLAGVAGLKTEYNFTEIAPLVGFDSMMIHRTVFSDIPPPWCFSLMEGDFDEALIGNKLTEQGYEKAEYGTYTYYWKNEDMGIDINSKITQWVMADLNRIALFDNTIVTAPATDIMTGVLDAMSGDEVAVIDNAVCRALADSLGDVISAVIFTPDRLLIAFDEGETQLPFTFTVPEGWGTLHQYDMAAMGYQDDGEERYFLVSLYYMDVEAARSDAGELVKRMESYVLMTPMPNVENIALTDWVEVGEAMVQSYPDGATLTVSCKFHSGRGSVNMLMGLLGFRDAFYLKPDPSIYVGEG